MPPINDFRGFSEMYILGVHETPPPPLNLNEHE